MSKNPSKTLEFRPNFENYKKWLKGSLGLQGIGVITFIAIAWRSSPVVGIFVSIGLVLLTIVVIRTVMKSPHVRVIVTDNLLIHYGPFGGKKTFKLTDPIDGILTQYHDTGTYLISDPVGYTMLLIKDGATKKRLRLLDAYWDQDDLQKIAKLLHLEVSDKDMSAAQVEATHPGLVRGYLKHPKRFIWMWSIIGTVVTCGVIYLIATLIDG